MSPFELAIVVLLVTTGLVAVHLSFSQSSPRKTVSSVSAANRLANLNCPTCVRPVCQTAATNASYKVISRSDPEWHELDKSEWTPRQRVAGEAVWITITCPFCNEKFTVDDLGVPIEVAANPKRSPKTASDLPPAEAPAG